MSPLRCTALAAAILAVAPASACAAGGFLPPRNLAPARDGSPPHAADFNARGEALFAVNRDLGGGKGAIFVDRRRPGGPLKRQVLPAAGSAQITESTSVAADLAPNGRGVVAWTQGDTILYSLRAPGGSFGPPKTASVPISDTTGLDTVSVATDAAGNVTFAWTDASGSGFGSKTTLHTVQRRASDGAFVSGQLVDDPGSGSHAIDPRLHVTASGRALLTYPITFPGPPTGKFAFRDKAVGGFGPPVSVNSLNSVISGAIDERGDAAVAYEQGNVVRIQPRPAGGPLGAPIDLDTTPGEADTPLVGLRGNAVATVVWTRTDSGTHKLVTCRVSATGCATGTRSAIATSSQPLYAFALAEAPSGAAIVVLQPVTNFVGPLLAAARTGPGPFRPAKLLGASDSEDGLAGIDRAGDGIVSWRQDDAGGNRVRFAGFDPNKPRIVTLAVPKKGRVGKPLHFAAKAFDVWGKVRYRWRFGDGGKAKGPTPVHTYSQDGKRTVRLTVRDAVANVATATRTVKVRPLSAR